MAKGVIAAVIAITLLSIGLARTQTFFNPRTGYLLVDHLAPNYLYINVAGGPSGDRLRLR